jgi:hypothetical protein
MMRRRARRSLYTHDGERLEILACCPGMIELLSVFYLNVEIINLLRSTSIKDGSRCISER